MLEWQFFVMHREGETAFASWFSGLGGAQWIRNLAAEGKATVTAEGGYPTRFQTSAKNLLGFLKAGRPPAGHRKFVIGDDYIDLGFELIEAGTGNKQRLSDFRGRPVLVNFWATWCAPCRTEMPALEEAAATYRDAGLQVLAVNFGESQPAVLAFAGELSLQLPLLLDSDGAVQQSYRVPGYPSSYFIDRQGRVAAVHLGILTEDQLSARLATILR